MKRVIINASCALLLMLMQTNVDAAFGIQAMAQFGIIAAVLSGMTSMNMLPSAVSMLILALICDSFASGPIGLYAIAFMLVFGFSRVVINRFKSERIIAVMIFSAIMTLFFELLLALLYSAYYMDTVYHTIFLRVFWKDIILTALFSPCMLWLNLAFDVLFSRRRKKGLT